MNDLTNIPEPFSLERVVLRLKGTDYGTLINNYEGKPDYIEVFRGTMQEITLVELFDNLDNAIAWLNQRMGLTH